MPLPILLKIRTPEGEAESIECESVTFFACDNAEGDGGGSVGIRRGHIPALAALDARSPITAKVGGKTVYSAVALGGFASVRDNVVTVVTERTEWISDP